MLTLNIHSNGEIQIVQKMEAPAVYLDHWAAMDIAENQESADRFKEIILRRQGTLMLSWINLLEFSEIKKKRQIEQVETFLESISPRLGFIDVIPKHVINKENECLRGARTTAPQVDSLLLSFFGKMQRTSMDPLNPKGLFSNLNHQKLKEMNRKFHLQSSGIIRDRRKRVKNNPILQSQIKKVPQGKNIHTLTRYIDCDILSSLIRDTNSHIPDSNDWRDYYHTVVPIAYCNYVLLDKGWSHKANESICRLRKYGYTSEMAKVFSKKDIDKFWIAFNGDCSF